jgi:nucleotide-binding universal stress UspA family protein
MYKTILLPLDGSPFSARAIPVAASLAKRTGATLHVVSVLDPSAYVPFVPGEVLVPVMDTDALEARRQADTESLQQVASELGAQGIHATGTLLEGTVVESIGEYAVQIRADLVVMTTHGRSGLERLWLGSVATAFIQRAPCAVYLVRPSGGSAPVAEPPLPKGPVLVPLDGSAFGDSIVYHAARLAEALDAPLALYTVAIPHAIPMAPFGAEALLADEGDLSHQEQEARERLTALAGTLPPNCTIDVGTDMTAARPIIEKAAAINASVIAMATHGRTGLARLVMGSVADAVLRGAPQALLLYRPTDREQQHA